ncbi:MAG: nucleotidyltransferase domain-containing protein [Propionibacteriaceae bacterium]
MLTETRLRGLAHELVAVSGVLGVMLGGSRARGDHHPDSDVDLGIYYRPPLDTASLRTLARRVATGRPDQGPEPDVTEPGGWGPWVDGGGWLTIDATPVDWIYRDVDRVRHSADLALRGEFEFHVQVGHPLGMPDFAYAGEVALGVVLVDPTGQLSHLQQTLKPYPPDLRQSVIARLDEARFLLGVVPKPAGRCDTTFVAGCLFRVIALCAHAIHARAGRWVVNEKGLVAAADRLAPATLGFGRRAQGVMGGLGSQPAQLLSAVHDAKQLLDDVEDLIGGG